MPTKLKIEPCYWGGPRIEKFAAKVASVMEFNALNEKSDLSKCIQTFGGEVDLSPEPDCDSITVKGKHNFKITLSKDASEGRKRFSLAHELGHYFLHSKQGEVPLTAYRLGTSDTESEANRFAAALLMPLSSFTEAWNNLGYSDSARPVFLSDQFRVTSAAARVRAQSLNLL